MTCGGETKVENDLSGVENAPGSGFVKKHSPQSCGRKCCKVKKKPLATFDRHACSVDQFLRLFFGSAPITIHIMTRLSTEGKLSGIFS